MKLSDKFYEALKEAKYFAVPISYRWVSEFIQLEQEIEKLKLENERLVKKRKIDSWQVGDSWIQTNETK